MFAGHFGRSYLATESEPEPCGYTLVIDAGHGGMDGGAVADDGTVEKDLNLKVADRMATLCTVLGIEYKMTRTDDVMLCDMSSSHRKLDDLYNRIKLTESITQPVFLSIHMNKFPVAKYSGLQVYYSTYDGRSQEIADAIQAFTAEILMPENGRKTKAAGSSIFVLDKATYPAVLVECGFLSNRDELSKLKTDEYQKALALTVLAPVAEYILK
ncbi:MAG: N-acetylmuramoyl-L-alanine amidase [Clostridia bacterium]|nr:N-acetylmuramoyl-L-alanine amidase [Clostridia bacterium]